MSALHHHPAAGHQYWTPVEKLILHLSPVTKRKSVKNSLSKQAVAKQARDRRTRSEPSEQQQARPSSGGTAGRAARNILRRANACSNAVAGGGSDTLTTSLKGGNNGSVSSGSLSSPSSSDNASSNGCDGRTGADTLNFSNELHTMKYFGLNKVCTIRGIMCNVSGSV